MNYNIVLTNIKLFYLHDFCSTDIQLLSLFSLLSLILSRTFITCCSSSNIARLLQLGECFVTSLSNVADRQGEMDRKTITINNGSGVNLL